MYELISQYDVSEWSKKAPHQGLYEGVFYALVKIRQQFFLSKTTRTDDNPKRFDCQSFEKLNNEEEYKVVKKKEKNGRLTIFSRLNHQRPHDLKYIYGNGW